jgi:beta-galactosidase
MIRHTLLLAASAMALATIGASARAQGAAQATLSQSSGQSPDDRHIETLSAGWRFLLGSAPAGVETPAFDDSSWPQVAVPHSWNHVGTYLPTVKTRINTPERIDKTQGTGWYRLTFTPAPTAPGQRTWLEFDAASRIARIWLNGRLLGAHAGGYSRFRLDATAALLPGARNVLVVETDNSKPVPGASTADVLPLTGDFFVPGGLYRPVRLIVTDAVHLDMMDAGGPGAYATTRAVDRTAAAVDVVARLRNDAAGPMALRVRSRLIDTGGQVAASAEQGLTLAAGNNAEIRLNLAVPGAHLWQGVTDPYLYRFVTEITTADGRLLDRLEQPFGIRTMGFDPQHGFVLNGKPYALHGVGYHQDREDKGWAIDPSDVEGDVRLLREMGATSLRLTHYEHGQAIHDLADRYGIILWDEVPLVSAWTQGNAKLASDALLANARQQLTELIRQNQNHASVAVWGIGNEVDFGNSLPGFITGGTGTPPDPAPILRVLNATAKAADPARPTVLATCCEGRLFATGVDVPITATQADMSGANRYFGWYYGEPQDLSGHLDALRAKRPGQPLAITEYGGGGALSIHTDNVLGGPVDSRGRAQPEEYESYVHERNWAVLATKPYLWATWLWAGFDFASTVRHEGDADDINTKGLVAFDHKTRKDAYYFYKANWSTNPTVRITGRRYVERAYATTDVRVYSNAASTVLSVNGQALGVQTACPQQTCVWHDVHLRQGDNALVAQGNFATGKVADTVGWTVSADAATAVRIDSGTLVAAAGARVRFGSDTFFQGGTAGSVVPPADYGKPVQPVTIAGTEDSGVAATFRQGTFSYRIPLADGPHRVRLTFIEPAAHPGERVFDVLADGRVMLGQLDLAKEGAGPATAIERDFVARAHGGWLLLAFRPTKGQAIVSAIQVEPARP